MRTSPISELPGIPSSAVVGLNRVGIVTIQDLLDAEFDHVAYVLDSYDDAERIVRTAMRHVSAEGQAGSRVTAAGTSRARETGTTAGRESGLRPRQASGAPSASGGGSTARPGGEGTTGARVAGQPVAAPRVAGTAGRDGANELRPARTVPTDGGRSLSLVRLGRALSVALRHQSTEIEAGVCMPRVMHRAAVAALVMEHGGSEDAAIAALLYADAREPSQPTKEEVEQAFGRRVAELIEQVAGLRVVPLEPSGAPAAWYASRVAAADEAVRLLLAAETVQHARSLLSQLRAEGAGVWQRFPGGREGSLWYYRTMTGALRRGSAPTGLLEELSAAVESLESGDG